MTADAIQSCGGQVPLLAVREVVQNLIHAAFRDASISVLDAGCEVIVADRGTGIPDPDVAVRAGFSTADERSRRLLRGVGSGLDLAARLMQVAGGKLVVEPNLGGGTVVSLKAGAPPAERTGRRRAPDAVPTHALGERQKQVLLGLADGRECGPSLVADLVGCSLATAYRDLAQLEQMGLVLYVGRGKRVIGPEGLHLVSRLLQGPAPARGASRTRRDNV